MFGFISTCCLNKHERITWSRYYCTLCLALKRHFGQLSRFSLNKDSVFLSLLCSESPDANEPTEKHRCSLRRFRYVRHYATDTAAVKYAAVVSVLSGCVKIGDNIRDKSGFAGHFPTGASMIQRHLERKVRTFCSKEDIDLSPVMNHVRTQLELEESGTRDFNRYLHPTEDAIGFVFREAALHTAHQQFADRYTEIGKAYGRLMYLSDACRDLKKDRRTGVFNPLLHCFSGGSITIRAREIYEQSVQTLEHLVSLIPVSSLCMTLLTGQLAHQGRLLFSTVPSDKSSRKGSRSGCCDASDLLCCDCSGCCDCASSGSGDGCSGCDCPDCNCCDCAGGDCCSCDCS